MRIAITGAGGFVGQALTRHLRRARDCTLTLSDLSDRGLVSDGSSRLVVGDLFDAETRRAVCADADVMIHLAALPGGASEADYSASVRTNLEASLGLLEETARAGPMRFVYASSIAVFGAPLPARISDETPPRPSMSYGAHKLMVEVALENASRLGRLDGIALRLPGVVARPGRADGLKSAFMSSVFQNLARGEPFESPVSPDATVWVMSTNVAVRNLVHAVDASLPGRRAITLPALRLRMAELVGEIARVTGSSAKVTYRADAALEAQFGAMPPLDADAARAAGFIDDGDAAHLVARVFEALRESSDVV